MLIFELLELFHSQSRPTNFEVAKNISTRESAEDGSLVMYTREVGENGRDKNPRSATYGPESRKFDFLPLRRNGLGDGGDGGDSGGDDSTDKDAEGLGSLDGVDAPEASTTMALNGASGKGDTGGEEKCLDVGLKSSLVERSKGNGGT